MRVNSSGLAGDPGEKIFCNIGIISKVLRKNYRNRSDQFFPATSVPRVAPKVVGLTRGGGLIGGGYSPLFILD